LSIVFPNRVPSAFTSGGGFKPPHDFAWLPAAEEELTERLNKAVEQDAVRVDRQNGIGLQNPWPLRLE
jgi:hypothetical protein